MKRINSVIVGMGEIGTGLFELLKRRYEVYGIDKDSNKNCYSVQGVELKEPEKCKYLNICIPYSNKFVEIVSEYIHKYESDLVIIHSSVPIGTTKSFMKAVHSPVRGKHPDMAKGLKAYIKFIGYNDERLGALAVDYLGSCMRVIKLENSNTTEAAKILSLARYCVYLGVADEMKKVCDKAGVDYEKAVKFWELDYNAGIRKSEPDHLRPVYDPPNGKIGGHCVLPITEMLVNDKRFSTPIISEAFQKY